MILVYPKELSKLHYFRTGGQRKLLWKSIFIYEKTITIFHKQASKKLLFHFGDLQEASKNYIFS